jgi:UDP-3-O-acyl N-acetylglucosamine deacetylase
MRTRPRFQRTIASAVEVTGIGFLTGADVRLRFQPAPAGHGIAFLRTDVPAPPIPARVEYTVPRQRRTGLSNGHVTLELVEHVMAALAGLQVDNCLVTLNATEPPGLDGSCLAFCDALLSAGFVEQGLPREVHVVTESCGLTFDTGRVAIAADPDDSVATTIDYTLDYGPQSPIPTQSYSFRLTPQTFLDEIAFARTFVLDHEARALRSQGYGTRLTEKDLLIFGPEGVMGNAVRAPEECARHKILDCVGDLALMGCDIRGRISCLRSGHQHNADLVRLLQTTQAVKQPLPLRRAA